MSTKDSSDAGDGSGLATRIGCLGESTKYTRLERLGAASSGRGTIMGFRATGAETRRIGRGRDRSSLGGAGGAERRLDFLDFTVTVGDASSAALVGTMGMIHWSQMASMLYET